MAVLGHHTSGLAARDLRVARWLRELMQFAGIDTSTFKGHSIRGAVTTETVRQGFSISDILQFTDWSQSNTSLSASI